MQDPGSGLMKNVYCPEWAKIASPNASAWDVTATEKTAANKKSGERCNMSYLRDIYLL
jgi:hypothetical protein